MTHPVETAVSPLKAEALARAEKDALDLIHRLIAQLEEKGWDLDKVAPRPNGQMSREQYQTMAHRHSLFERVTTWVKPTFRLNEPNLRKRSPENEAQFVADAVTLAGQQYDAFVAKLIGKVGDCDSATLTGSHVWGYSILTVVKGERIERWQTQQIVNQSKLGTLFNQWPSRLLKR